MHQQCHEFCLIVCMSEHLLNRQIVAISSGRGDHGAPRAALWSACGGRGLRYPISVARQLVVVELPRRGRSEVRPNSSCACMAVRARPASHDTVGCVALDADGLLVAGTSTAGEDHNPAGRVGVSAQVGCGFYWRSALGHQQLSLHMSVFEELVGGAHRRDG